MKKTISLILTLVLVTGLLTISPVRAETEKLGNIIGTTPNGTPVTEEQAREIQDKLDNAMKNAYTENIDMFNNDMGLLDKYSISNKLEDASYLSARNKQNILQTIEKLTGEGKDIVSFSATTYFVTEDALGITTPLTNEEVKEKLTIDGDISIQSLEDYGVLTVIATVYDNGSTSSKRKYEMFGGVLWDDVQSDSYVLDNAIGIRWAGNEAITSHYSYTEYQDVVSPPITIDNRFEDAINNGGVIYTMYGRYGSKSYPTWAGVTAYTEQYGAPTQIYNMKTTYIYTWLTIIYNFGFDSDGLSISVSPGLTSTSYVCLTTYGKK